MAFEVTKECIGCGNCEKECPIEAIKVVNGTAVINQDECIECGVCYHSCPLEVIIKK